MAKQKNQSLVARACAVFSFDTSLSSRVASKILKTDQFSSLAIFVQPPRKPLSDALRDLVSVTIWRLYDRLTLSSTFLSILSVA